MTRGRQAQDSRSELHEQGPPPTHWLVWLDALGIAWLIVVISAYALLAFHPFVPTIREVPGIAEAERVVPVLLASLVAVGIIRYLLCRSLEARSLGQPGPEERNNP